MGRYIRITNSTAFVPADKLETAFEKMCALNTTHHDAKNGGTWSQGKRVASWFSWMDADYPSVCADAQAIFEMMGFETEYRENGDLMLCGYDGKQGQEELFLTAIADELRGQIDWADEDGFEWHQNLSAPADIRFIAKSMQAKFLELFPNSHFDIGRGALGGALGNSLCVSFTLLQRDDYPFKIINNDPMYHIIFIDTEGDKYNVSTTLSGLYLKPTNTMYAFDVVKTKMRKKVGTVEQVNKHVAKWLDGLKATVVENKGNFKCEFDRDHYII